MQTFLNTVAILFALLSAWGSGQALRDAQAAVKQNDSLQAVHVHIARMFLLTFWAIWLITRT
jgi:hypothetical protein